MGRIFEILNYSTSNSNIQNYSTFTALLEMEFEYSKCNIRYSKLGSNSNNSNSIKLIKLQQTTLEVQQSSVFPHYPFQDPGTLIYYPTGTRVPFSGKKEPENQRICPFPVSPYAFPAGSRFPEHVNDEKGLPETKPYFYTNFTKSFNLSNHWSNRK